VRSFSADNTLATQHDDKISRGLKKDVQLKKCQVDSKSQGERWLKRRLLEMDWITEPERKIPIVAGVDMLVCGGGVAGVAAAVSAARNGVRVLLVERYGFLGGLATGGLVITTPPLNNGINSEIRKRLEDAKTYRKCRDTGDDPAVASLVAVDPEVLKYELVRMLLEQNVKLLLHTYIVQSIMEDNVIKGVIVESKGGRAAILAKMIVDVTGDGDVSASAKAPYEIAEEPLPVTLMFNMVDVDTKKAIKQIGNWGNLRKLVEEAVKSGELSFDLELYTKGFAPGVFAANLCYPGEINVWSGSLFGINGLDPEQLTKAEIVTREHAMRLATFLKKKLSGFEKSRIEYTATQVGVRETRRVIGGIIPSLDDVMTQKFSDTVAKPYSDREMRVPYRSLVPQQVENLLVAGRCISAKQDAMVQLRLIPVCFATGQAAGTAAALALREGVKPRQLNVSLLQRTITSQGMALGL